MLRKSSPLPKLKPNARDGPRTVFAACLTRSSYLAASGLVPLNCASLPAERVHVPGVHLKVVDQRSLQAFLDFIRHTAGVLAYYGQVLQQGHLREEKRVVGAQAPHLERVLESFSPAVLPDFLRDVVHLTVGHAGKHREG